jgi:LacI family transcriptional regulator
MPNPMRGVVLVRCPHPLTAPPGQAVASIVESLESYGLVPMLSGSEAGALGAILVRPPDPVHVLQRLRNRRYPFALVDSRPPVLRDVPAAWSDPAAGVRDLAAHLRALGHGRIALITCATAPAGVGFAPHLVRRVAEPSPEHGRRAAGELLERPGAPTALICADDRLATGALRAAADRGLRVPRDLSVAALDESGLGALARPELTVARAPWPALGRTAAALLAQLLDGIDPIPHSVEVPPDLSLAASTGPVIAEPLHPAGVA